jgi:hypothetical protein
MLLDDYISFNMFLLNVLIIVHDPSSFSLLRGYCGYYKFNVCMFPFVTSNWLIMAENVLKMVKKICNLSLHENRVGDYLNLRVVISVFSMLKLM